MYLVTGSFHVDQFSPDYWSLTNIMQRQCWANFSLQIWRQISEQRKGGRQQPGQEVSHPHGVWGGGNLTRHTSFVPGMKGERGWAVWESSGEVDSTPGRRALQPGSSSAQQLSDETRSDRVHRSPAAGGLSTQSTAKATDGGCTCDSTQSDWHAAPNLWHVVIVSCCLSSGSAVHTHTWCSHTINTNNTNTVKGTETCLTLQGENKTTVSSHCVKQKWK